jgi:hypothetical protein
MEENLGGSGAIETDETRIYISNLDYGVSNEDIKGTYIFPLWW